MAIILASASPRRRELLQMAGFPDFKIITSNAPERLPATSPGAAVAAIALDKARDVKTQCGQDDIIIAADTLVFLGGEPLGKPKDEKDAAVMLSMLSDRKHTVYTGVAVLHNNSAITAHEATDVYFKKLTTREISDYVETGEPLDKAGAYAAQGRGAIFIERIDGDFYNVVGLPICRLTQMLNNLTGTF